MRSVQFKCIREVSSEDNVHKAENLLHLQAGKKWKTKLVGEQSAFVIIELREPINITGIDIGNEHSAFVEVSAAKLGNTRNEFLEVLTTCSFMTPIESKNSTTTNRVRCFGKKSLVEGSKNIKFQVIKVVCSQPFNKFVQYGLAFIKIYAENDQKSEDFEVVEKLNKKGDKILFGRFTLRNDSTDSENEKCESIFQRWKNERKNTPEKGVSNTPLSSKQIDTSPSKHGPRGHKQRRDQTLEANSRIEQGLEGRNDYQLASSKTNSDQPFVKRKKLQKASGEKVIRESKTKTDNLGIIEPKTKEENDHVVGKLTPYSDSENFRKSKCSLNNKTIDKIASKNIRFRPFSQLLKGSVIVISGIQNPDRGDLRSKALEMGAVYKSDWDNCCTHLICAFKNTPKYCQVLGKGKIVTRNWIESCYSSRKYLPWRRFALDGVKSESANSESDEEIWEESQRFSEYGSPEDKYTDKVESSNLIDSGNTLKDCSGNDTDDEIQAAIQSRSRQKNELKEKIGPTINAKQYVCDSSVEDFTNFVAQDSRKEIANDETKNIQEDNNQRERKSRKIRHRKNTNGNSTKSFKKESVYEVLTEEEEFLSLKNAMNNRATGRINIKQISMD